ncbi:hypothetical protein V6N12_064984 [Hibiscus sabdariffa]|uniref:Uncharacterized protein n=1 Tax=Hibiscus sabdariffa TaxID=183260 RepID=A0ABR2G7R1_9ROSI
MSLKKCASIKKPVVRDKAYLSHSFPLSDSASGSINRCIQSNTTVENVETVVEVEGLQVVPIDTTKAVEVGVYIAEPQVTTTDIAVEDAAVTADMVDSQGVVTEMEAIETIVDMSTQDNMVQSQMNDADKSQAAQNLLQTDGHGSDFSERSALRVMEM